MYYVVIASEASLTHWRTKRFVKILEEIDWNYLDKMESEMEMKWMILRRRKDTAQAPNRDFFIFFSKSKTQYNILFRATDLKNKLYAKQFYTHTHTETH